MLKRRFVTLITTASLIALASGCAGRTDSRSRSAAPLTGTWHGSCGMIRAPFFYLEANVTLKIKDDGTYSMIVTRRTVGGNNRARPFEEAGTVVPTSRGIVFHNSDGSQLALVRKGDTLYGVFQEFLTELSVMIRLDRVE
jgi:uncharacterized lipoprotein NlpE involved in copper resistance